MAIFEETFESYADGSNINGQGSWVASGTLWTVSTAQSLGGSKSLKYDGNAGESAKRVFGDRTSITQFDFYVYLEAQGGTFADKKIMISDSADTAGWGIVAKIDLGTNWFTLDTAGNHLDTGISATLGQWYHFKYVYYPSSNNAKLYIDDTLVGTVTVAYTPNKIALYGDENTKFYVDSILVDPPSTENTENITNYFNMISPPTVTEDISNDFRMANAIEYDYDINNKINTHKLVYSDINNKINTSLQQLYDIQNKINTVKQVTDDLGNLISFVDETKEDIENDIRTQALELSDVSNDFRMIKSWQKAGNVGFVSSGKGYIKCYIGGIEQTDFVVDTVIINKVPNEAHTAVFELGRAYDSTAPSKETTVEIKYRDIRLYYGYITKVTPSDNPEHIRIECSNKYWKQNQENKVWFYVGHEPNDSRDVYYNTISEGLSSGCGFSVPFGSFVPETMDLFGIGQSDAITSLINNAGNFGWYYDINENKKIIKYGQGNIIKLNRQEIGTNIGLHQVLNHNMEESVENLVNKFRVQMGDKVIRNIDNDKNSSRTWRIAGLWSTTIVPSPMWDEDYEVLAKNSDDNYGFDYFNEDNAYKYEDVFKKYNLNFSLDSYGSAFGTAVNWANNYTINENIAPEVIIQADSHTEFSYSSSYGEEDYFRCTIPLIESDNFLSLSKYRVLDGGYNIDWTEGVLTFNEPIYIEVLNSNGEVIGIRRPLITVKVWFRPLVTDLDSDTDNPESDITNPLMFFTDKMGSYSKTIIEPLNLGNLSIQQGGSYRERTTEYYTDANGQRHYYYNYYYIPSWDDTSFANDYANWQLSKKCDVKKTGNIEVTLDCAIFNSISLNNRIKVPGMIDTPLNVMSLRYDLNTFTVTVGLENGRYYKRTISKPYRGDNT